MRSTSSILVGILLGVCPMPSWGFDLKGLYNTGLSYYSHWGYSSSYSKRQQTYTKDNFLDKVDKAIENIQKALLSEDGGQDIHTLYRDSILGLVQDAQSQGFGRDPYQVTESDLFTKRLYKFSANETAEWLTPVDAQLKKLQTKKNFVDVTEFDVEAAYKPKKGKSKIPSKPRNQLIVKEFFKSLSQEDMIEFLTKLTSFYNRYYNSQNGAKSSQFIFESLSDILADNPEHRGITLSYFTHSWPQKSIIARFEGKDKSNDEIVVVGAHQDSINQWIPWFGKAPGADDDGSGTTSTISAFKALVEGGFTPNRTLEFHWYAAEEAGLLGSQDIAKAYSLQKKNVVAMMHFDMTGHFVGKERIAVVQDYTDPELTSLLRRLIEEYSDLDWIDSRCGYGCSDHASWNKYGFRSAFPIEDPDIESNPNIHSTKDVVSTINFHHVSQFAQLAIAFAIELSTGSK